MGSSELLDAVYSNDAAEVESLLTDKKASKNFDRREIDETRYLTGKYNYTLLYWAGHNYRYHSEAKAEKIFNLLLQHGFADSIHMKNADGCLLLDKLVEKQCTALICDYADFMSNPQGQQIPTCNNNDKGYVTAARYILSLVDYKRAAIFFQNTINAELHWDGKALNNLADAGQWGLVRSIIKATSKKARKADHNRAVLKNLFDYALKNNQKNEVNVLLISEDFLDEELRNDMMHFVAKKVADKEESVNFLVFSILTQAVLSPEQYAILLDPIFESDNSALQNDVIHMTGVVFSSLASLFISELKAESFRSHDHILTLLASTKLAADEASALMLASYSSKNDDLKKEILKLDAQWLNVENGACPLYPLLRAEEKNTELLAAKSALPSESFLLDEAGSGHWDWVQMIVNKFDESNLGLLSAVLGKLLHKAIDQKNSEMVAFLLEKGASCDVTDANEKPIVRAASNQDWESVKAFFKRSTNESDTFEYGKAVIICSRYRQVELASQLLKCGASIDKEASYYHEEHTAMRWAIEYDEHNFLSELAKSNNTNTSLGKINGVETYPVQYIFSRSEIATINAFKKLVTCGVEVYPRANNEMIKAAKADRWPLLKKLWAVKSPNDQSQLLADLMHIAVDQNNTDMVAFLIDNHSAPRNYLTQVGTQKVTPVEHAAYRGHWETLQVLARYNTDKKDTYRYGTAFLRCLMVGKLDLAKKLFAAGAGINEALPKLYEEKFINDFGHNDDRETPDDIVGFTALHFAVSVVDEDSNILDKLTQCGDIEVNAKSQSGITPFMLAIQMQKATAIRLMLTADKMPDVSEIEVKAIIDQAKTAADEGWYCVEAFLKNDGKIEPSLKFPLYFDLLSIAVNQNLTSRTTNVRDLVPLLAGKCIEQNQKMIDSLHIVKAARLGRWQVLAALLEKIKDGSHQQFYQKDFTLALMLALKAKDEVSIALLNEMCDTTKLSDTLIQERDRVLMGLSQDNLGCDVLDFAIRFNNNHVQGFIMMASTRHLKVAINVGNVPAMLCLLDKGQHLNQDTVFLIDVCKSGRWSIVKKYLQKVTDSVKNNGNTDDIKALCSQLHEFQLLDDKYDVDKIWLAKQIAELDNRRIKLDRTPGGLSGINNPNGPGMFAGSGNQQIGMAAAAYAGPSQGCGK